MSDILRGAGYTLLGLFAMARFVTHRVEAAARHDLSQALPGSHVRVDIQSRGLLGIDFGQAYSTKISGHDFAITGLPFGLEPRRPGTATIRFLLVDFQRVTVGTLTIERLKVSFPFAHVDGARALLSGHLSIVSALPGTGSILISAQSVAAMALMAQPGLSEPKVELSAGRVLLSGMISLFGTPQPFQADTGLAVDAGRYINIVDPHLKVAGRDVAPSLAASMIAKLNPLVDIRKNAALGSWVVLQRVDVSGAGLRLGVLVTIPNLGHATPLTGPADRIAPTGSGAATECTRVEQEVGE